MNIELTEEKIKSFSSKKYIEYRLQIKQFYKEKRVVEKIFNLDEKINRVYWDIHSRCNNINQQNYKYYGGRGIKNYITKEEIKFLWKRDNAFSMKCPSIDREDNDGHYCLENCRFIEMTKNVNRNSEMLKIPILQFDKNNNPIAEWESLTMASKILKIDISGISHCLRGRRKTHKGFIWKLK